MQLLWLSLAAILSTATVCVSVCIDVLLYNCESVYRCVPSVCCISPCMSVPPSLSLSLRCCTRPAIYVSFGLQGLLARRLAWSLPQAGRQAGRGAGQCLLIVSYLRFCTDYIIYAKIDAQIECELAIDNLYKQFKARPSANITGQRQHSSTSTR